MLVNTPSLIAIQSYNSQQATERAGAAERTPVKPGVLSKTAERGLREPFVLVDLSDDAVAKLALKDPAGPKQEPAASKPEAKPDTTSSNKFLREAPNTNAQPVFSRPGTNLDISV